MAPGPKDLRRPGSHRWGRGAAPLTAPLILKGTCVAHPWIPRPLVVDTTGRR